MCGPLRVLSAGSAASEGPRRSREQPKPKPRLLQQSGPITTRSGHSIPRVATPGGGRAVIVPPRRRHPRAPIALLPRTVRMSSSSHASDTSITGRDKLVGYVASAETHRADWRIGTEHEKFGFRLEALRPPEFDGERGIESDRKSGV